MNWAQQISCLHLLHHPNAYPGTRSQQHPGMIHTLHRKIRKSSRHRVNPKFRRLTRQAESGEAAYVPRADDVLPNNLPDAIKEASEATATAIAAGASRCLVEILLPEFWDPTSGAVFKEEGDQRRFWQLTRRFIENLVVATGSKNVRAMYPDMGVTAMLESQWPDIDFALGSLNDRVLVDEKDDLIVIAAPDPRTAESCAKLASEVSPEQSIVMFNPRLVSGDVGVGLNMRRMRSIFLNTFIITYSLCPIGDIGSVLRRYPGVWQVFVEDEDLPGRYKLIAEKAERPTGDLLNAIIDSGSDIENMNEPGSENSPGVMSQLASTVSSLQRFLKSLSN